MRTLTSNRNFFTLFFPVESSFLSSLLSESSKSFVSFILGVVTGSVNLRARAPCCCFFTGVSSSLGESLSTLSFGIGESEISGSPKGDRKGDRYGEVQTGDSKSPPHTERPPGEDCTGET